MLKLKKAPVLLCQCALVLSTSGCGYMFGDQGVFRDRSEDYKKAPQTAPVKVPEGMESAPLRDLYVIPPVADVATSEVPPFL